MSQPLTTFAETVNRVDQVLADENVPWPIDDDMRALLIVIRRHIGKDNAISRTDLGAALNTHDRTVRERIHDLRENFGVAIGANRARGGYFLVSNAEEALEMSQPLFHQAFSLLRTARALGGRHLTAEWLGQARIDLKLDEETV